ncbi:MAG: hypothetical protein HY342_12775 [Candidatus Lambdaproteobacteria bacterium]|nr:hypothetical protein [Candidatus Lambdaproteobacteria bacterium]
MLAFNLGIFFRNLSGTEVVFSARNGLCEVSFTGGVQQLQEHTDLTHHLIVTLAKGEVACEIAFDDDQEPEEDEPEEAPVRVHMFQVVDGAAFDLLRSEFRFEDITLKPLVEPAEQAAEGAAAGEGGAAEGQDERSGPHKPDLR